MFFNYLSESRSEVPGPKTKKCILSEYANHSHVHLRSIFDTIPRVILQCLCHAKNNKLLNSTYNALIFINIACMQTVISYGQLYFLKHE